MDSSKRVLALFDVDGTLTPARNGIKENMVQALEKLQKKVHVAVVGGSDMKKIVEQLAVTRMNYAFFENGLVAAKKGVLFAETSIQEALGEVNLKRLINFCLRYLADIDIPIKRGTFIEYRMGMINVSPIGRNCSQKERDDYEIFDLENKIREKFIAVLKEEFKDLNLTFSIGGQISFDVFPVGWDKTFCLKFIEKEYDEIHFFGDKTFEGGNDHQIYEDARTIGHSVKNPEDTIRLLEEIFKINE